MHMPPGGNRKNNENSCVPDVRSPRRSFVDNLNEEDRFILHTFTTDSIECMFQGKFRNARTECELFGTRGGKTSSARSKSKIVESVEKKSTTGTLTAEEERLLFERYNYARYRLCKLLQANEGKRLTIKAAREVITWGTRALKARAQIIQLNVPLVLSMTKRSRLDGVDFNELVSEGSMALMRSAEKFDVSRGFKFSTYACRAILKSFSRVVMKASRYRGLFPVELNTELERSDFIERKRVGVEDDCIDELKHILGANLAQLSEVERKVIHERFALGTKNLDERAKTLEQVGEIIGLTKERVRQIQNKALKKIKVALEEQILVA